LAYFSPKAARPKSATFDQTLLGNINSTTHPVLSASEAVARGAALNGSWF
jgi:hypothetical protein